jgi:hypothetical protein
MLDQHDHHFMCISTMIVISCPCIISLWSYGYHSLPHTPSSHVLLMPNSNHLTHDISNLVLLITKTKLGLSSTKLRERESFLSKWMSEWRRWPLGAKGYGINTTHVTHKTVGSDRPQSLRDRARRFRAGQNRKYFSLAGILWRGLFELRKMFLSTWFHSNHY